MYRYFGFWLDEHMDFDVNAEILSNAGSRALGTIVSKFKSQKSGVSQKHLQLIKYKIEHLDIILVIIGSAQFQQCMVIPGGLNVNIDVMLSCWNTGTDWLKCQIIDL